MNTIKFHKSFGQVEIVNKDANTTTIVIVATGETKKLFNKYANLSDSPFEVVKTKKSKAQPIVLTKEEEERVENSVNKQMAEHQFVSGLFGDAKQQYLANKSRRIHL